MTSKTEIDAHFAEEALLDALKSMEEAETLSNKSCKGLAKVFLKHFHELDYQDWKDCVTSALSEFCTVYPIPPALGEQIEIAYQYYCTDQR